MRIGTPDGFGVHFLAPRLNRLATRHPDLALELVPVPRSFSLSQREADVAIIVGRPERGRAVVSRLTDYSLGLYAATGAVVWPVGLAMALFAFLGAQVGARLAMRLGARLIRPLLVFVACAMALKLLADPANPLTAALGPLLAH